MIQHNKVCNGARVVTNQLWVGGVSGEYVNIWIQ